MRRIAAVLVITCLASIPLGAAPLLAQEQPECTTGLCSGRRPAYNDTAWVSWIGHRIAVGTKEGQSPNDYVLTIFDLDTGIPPLNTNWDPSAGLMRRYHGPMDGSGFEDWRLDTLGSVFGLTLDNRGNIYVTATSCYFGDVVSLLPGATSGSVFKVDRTTGFVSVLANLPQQSDPNYTPGADRPGLGNITYDPIHDCLFVTDEEDGKIYRLGMNGAITATFDPMVADNGQAGWAPLGERLWGIQWHADNHLYYSVWKTDMRFNGSGNFNSIRRVALDGSGFFLPASDAQVLQVPHLSGASAYSDPVSDISFKPNGNMLLAEHGMQNETYPFAHDSRLLEYRCTPPPGGWVPSGNTFLVGTYNIQANSAGGVDASYYPYTGGVPGRVWVTGDALHLVTGDYIYGAQGFPPNGGGPPQSYLFDYDGDVINVDKYQIGDIEVTCPTDSGSIHGIKFKDEDCDGERDSNEVPLAGWTIVLTGPGGTYTAVTDGAGNYHFWNLPNGTYTLCELGQVGWTQTQPGGGCYPVTVSNNVTTGLNFGNCQSCPNPTACVKAPPNMMAWWPLDEPSPAIAHDISGFNPGAWMGGPTPGPGKRGGALCFGGPTQHVRVNDSGQINFGSTADFSIDAWIKPNTNGGARVILDKRVAVGANFRGYALGLQGASIVFFIQDGTSNVVTYTSPAVIVGNQWQHVAITVKRAVNGGTAYLNGSPIGIFNPMATGAGSITNSSPLYIGRNLAGTVGFEGCLDDIEIFCRELTATEVMNLWTPGKCREWCSTPPVIAFGPYQTSATATFTICNSNWSTPSMTYQWSLAGLPAGSCSVNGPTVYSPSSGTLVVPAGGCQTVSVTITRPPWLTPGNTGCYTFNVTNQITHECFNCTGVVKANSKIWGDVLSDPVVISTNATGTAQFTLHNDDPPGTISEVTFRVEGTYGDDYPGANPELRLNGLPPGEPWIATRIIPGGGGVVIGVPIEWGGPCTRTYIPDAFVKISIEGGVGMPPEDVASARIQIVDEHSADVEPLTPIIEAVNAWPNPTLRDLHVQLTVARKSQVEAGVYDLAGRRVRALVHGTLAAGTHDLTWDGRDEGGIPTRAGLYFVRMRADDRTYGTKVVKLH